MEVADWSDRSPHPTVMEPITRNWNQW